LLQKEEEEEEEEEAVMEVDAPQEVSMESQELPRQVLDGGRGMAVEAWGWGMVGETWGQGMVGEAWGQGMVREAWIGRVGLREGKIEANTRALNLTLHYDTIRFITLLLRSLHSP
jgi:hypothetical protein